MFRDVRKRWLAVAAVLAIAIIAGAGMAVASGAGDDERPITGDALDRASEAALNHTGEGRVTGTEIGDEEGYYEVEVTLDDGTQVDVHLDRNFEVLHTEDDGPGEDDD